jgi:hypothetical protein
MSAIANFYTANIGPTAAAIMDAYYQNDQPKVPTAADINLIKTELHKMRYTSLFLSAVWVCNIGMTIHYLAKSEIFQSLPHVGIAGLLHGSALPSLLDAVLLERKYASAKHVEHPSSIDAFKEQLIKDMRTTSTLVKIKQVVFG